jgi:hypothetical protein
MTEDREDRAWVFVSHSSKDLDAVRKVRNYLEKKGAAPLLFHLRSLREPDQLRAVIEREIEERNFFLHCESASADRSVWVRHEREFLRCAQQSRPIREGRISVDQGKISWRELDAFISNTIVLPCFDPDDRSRVEEQLAALRQADFQVLDGFPPLLPNAWGAPLAKEIRRASRGGWVVAFHSQHSLTLGGASEKSDELVPGRKPSATSTHTRLVPVLLDSMATPSSFLRFKPINATSESLPRALLTRS